MGNKLWAVLFGVVMLACGISYAVTPWAPWKMPAGDSTHAWDVDFLYWVILIIVAFFFFLTEGILVVFLWKYGSSGDHTHPVSSTKELPGFFKPIANILHDQHRVEMAWTFVPAAILLYIAFAQVNTWANVKFEARNREKNGKKAFVQIAVSARQFEWRMRYPSVKRFDAWVKDQKDEKGAYDSFGKVPQLDDVFTVNELHIVKEQTVQVHLTTRDVIHSLNLPNFRVKQDALPGKLIPVWFTPTKANCMLDKKKERWVDGRDPKTGQDDPDLIYDIPCAELCGWGHYRMIGRVYVHEDQKDFRNWLILAEETSRDRDGQAFSRAQKRHEETSKAK